MSIRSWDDIGQNLNFNVMRSPPSSLACEEMVSLHRAPAAMSVSPACCAKFLGSWLPCHIREAIQRSTLHTPRSHWLSDPMSNDIEMKDLSRLRTDNSADGSKTAAPLTWTMDGPTSVWAWTSSATFVSLLHCKHSLSFCDDTASQHSPYVCYCSPAYCYSWQRRPEGE